LRILIPDELPYSTGIENVVTSIVTEWLPEVEAITWLVPDQNRAKILSEKLGNPKNLHWETIHSASGNSQPPVQQKSFKDTLKEWVKKVPALRKKAYAAYRRRMDSKIAQVAEQSGATHCWFHFVQGQSVPQLSIPVCGLVHDQNFRFYPENSPVGKPAQFREALEDWIAHADMVSVLSQAGKEEIHSLGSPPSARIEIIPNAILPVSGEVPEEKREERQFLYPAAALAHKNQILLFKAAIELAEQGHPCKFVICGKDTDLFHGNEPANNTVVEEARIFYDQNRAVLSNYFEFKGECTWDELVKLYRTSFAVVLPSKYEGFGLPLVESLSRNTRVLCSNLIPFQEQVERYKAQDWVEFFDAEDSSSLAKAMLQTIQNPGTLPARFPVENFSSWTWKDVASRYLDLFQELSSR